MANGPSLLCGLQSAFLGALGSPGCVLHVGLEAPVGLFSGPAATRITLGVGVPRVAALAGATLYVQYLHVDGVAAGGVAFSNAARISVGR